MQSILRLVLVGAIGFGLGGVIVAGPSSQDPCDGCDIQCAAYTELDDNGGCPGLTMTWTEESPDADGCAQDDLMSGCVTCANCSSGWKHHWDCTGCPSGDCPVIGWELELCLVQPKVGPPVCVTTGGAGTGSTTGHNRIALEAFCGGESTYTFTVVDDMGNGTDSTLKLTCPCVK